MCNRVILEFPPDKHAPIEELNALVARWCMANDARVARAGQDYLGRFNYQTESLHTDQHRNVVSLAEKAMDQRYVRAEPSAA